MWRSLAGYLTRRHGRATRETAVQRSLGRLDSAHSALCWACSSRPFTDDHHTRVSRPPRLPGNVAAARHSPHPSWQLAVAGGEDETTRGQSAADSLTSIGWLAVAEPFPHLPAEIRSDLTMRRLQAMEQHWRQSQRQTLLSWQIAVLLRGLHACRPAEPHLAGLAWLLPCARLVEEALAVEATLNHEKALPPFVLFPETFLDRLMAICLAGCDQLEQTLTTLASDADAADSHAHESRAASASMSPYQRLLDTFLQIDRRLAARGATTRVQRDRANSDHEWTRGLVTLATKLARPTVALELIQSKRILFAVVGPHPTSDYAEYIRTLPARPSAWAPEERLGFLRRAFPQYEATPTPSDALEDRRILGELLRCLASAPSQATSTSAAVAVGLLGLIEEAQWEAASKQMDGKQSLSSRSRLQPHLLVGYSHALQVIHAAAENEASDLRLGMEVWLRLKRRIESTSLEKLSYRERQRLSRHPAVPGLPVPKFLLPTSTDVPTQLVRVLDAHADVDGVFFLAESLGWSVARPFLRAVVRAVTRDHVDLRSVTSAQSTASGQADSIHLQHLQRTRTLLNNHLTWLRHPLASSYSLDTTASDLFMLHLEVDGALGEWTVLQRHWAELQRTHLLQETLAAFEASTAYHQPAVQSDVMGSPPAEPSLPSAPLVSSAHLRRSLDLIGLAAMRLGEPLRLDTFAGDRAGMRVLLAWLTHTDHSFEDDQSFPGDIFRHALLWSAFLAQDWQLGVRVFQSGEAAFATRRSLFADSAIDMTDLSSPFHPAAWLHLGMDCVDQVRVMPSPPISTAADPMAAAIEEAALQVMADGLWKAGGSMDQVVSASSPGDTLRLHVHAHSDCDLPSVLSLLVRVLSRHDDRSGSKPTTVAIGPPLAVQSATPPPTPAPLALPSLSKPLAAVPHARYISLPSLLQPLANLAGWSRRKPALLPAVRLPTPFASSEMVVPPATMLDAPAHTAVSTLQAYLMEEASTAWLSAALPTSLSEQDSSVRARIILQRLVLELFGLRTPQQQRAGAEWRLTVDDVHTLIARRNLFTGPTPAAPLARQAAIREMVKHAYTKPAAEGKLFSQTERRSNALR